MSLLQVFIWLCFVILIIKELSVFLINDYINVFVGYLDNDNYNIYFKIDVLERIFQNFEMIVQEKMIYLDMLMRQVLFIIIEMEVKMKISDFQL